MFGILTVLVKVEVSVGIEHCLNGLWVYGQLLSVYPAVRVEEIQLVGAGVGGVVAVVGKVQAVVAIGFEVRGGVEEVILREGILCLHITPAQAAVDAEGEGFGGNIVADVGDGALLGREQGLAAAYTICCWIGVALGLGLRGVALQIGLCEVVDIDFAPIPVCHSQLVALVL